MKFNKNIDEAPKDRTILLDVGYPWPVVGHFNSLIEKWVYADVHYDCGEPYFINEYEKHPKGWAPLLK